MTYTCLFACLTTRAVHLELCIELSMQEFMAALEKFTARRGTPAHIYSDNRSNFIGAHQEILKLQRLHDAKETKIAISCFCMTMSIKWHFIPPQVPNFGRLWEAWCPKYEDTSEKACASPPPAFRRALHALS